ncbi:hypothetical protein [Lichenifustis flavocetrariae]|uniref:Uncharacterized protein n=1 Tax=Lichenifustis flavocetrariae TaxID=2949735 RepID=A0AA41YWT0_9HYPH|nr:hypothetical protein [Lichenifustis flavocetrariae]MCW6508696.1 hypothetical protein [Lichenifustis flavocetrariae]
MISMTYDFQLSDFQNANGPSPSPISRVSGSFTLGLDPSLPENSSVVIKLNSGTPRSTSGSGLSLGPILIEGAQNGGAIDEIGTNNFVLTLDLSNPPAPRFLTCDDIHGGMCGSLSGSTLAEAYVSPSDPTGLFFAASGTIEARTVTAPDVRLEAGPQTVSAVPLPASLPMAGSALLALAAATYGRKRTSKPL